MHMTAPVPDISESAPAEPRHPGTCVIAVVVSYQCDLARLMQQFERLLPQVECIVWVDNGSGPDDPAWLAGWPSGRIQPIWLHANTGIGYAQNRGIERALQNGATHVLLMDDDSVPSADMVRKLLQAIGALPDAAAVGPYHYDPRRPNAHSPFVRIHGLRARWITCGAEQPVPPVDHVIASGTLIPAPVLKQVGMMREDFFIDWVDIEWCLRARHLGYKIYGVCSARLEHSLGDRPISRLGREVQSHAPWRHYYQARNAVLIWRCRWVPFSWKLVSIRRQAVRMVFHSVFAPNPTAHLRMWLLGLWHGLRGVTGKIHL